MHQATACSEYPDTDLHLYERYRASLSCPAGDGWCDGEPIATSGEGHSMNPLVSSTESIRIAVVARLIGDHRNAPNLWLARRIVQELARLEASMPHGSGPQRGTGDGSDYPLTERQSARWQAN